MILFVHTPKSGGKSIRDALKAAYGERVQFHYVNPRKQHAQSALPFILRPHWPRKSTTDIVYGHFCFDQFQLYGLLNPVRRAMFFRHPLDLLCSSYFYRRGKHPEDYRDVSLIDYARRRDMQDFFYLYLGHTKVAGLDFVGLQEQFEASVTLFARVFGTELPVLHVNKTPERPTSYREHLKAQGILDEVSALMARNIGAYTEAETRFADLARVHNVDIEQGPVARSSLKT